MCLSCRPWPTSWAYIGPLELVALLSLPSSCLWPFCDAHMSFGLSAGHSIGLIIQADSVAAGTRSAPWAHVCFVFLSLFRSFFPFSFLPFLLVCFVPSSRFFLFVFFRFFFGGCTYKPSTTRTRTHPRNIIPGIRRGQTRSCIRNGGSFFHDES